MIRPFCDCMDFVEIDKKLDSGEIGGALQSCEKGGSGEGKRLLLNNLLVVGAKRVVEVAKASLSQL